MCDNWRDISLLDVMGKFVWCGFRAGRGCVDKVFCVCNKTIDIITKCFSCLLVLSKLIILFQDRHCDVLYRNVVYLTV